MRLAQALNSVSGWCLQKRMLSGDKVYNYSFHVISNLGLFFSNIQALWGKSKVGTLSNEVIFNVTRLHWENKMWKGWICNNHLQIKDSNLREIKCSNSCSGDFPCTHLFYNELLKWNSLSYYFIIIYYILRITEDLMPHSMEITFTCI